MGRRGWAMTFVSPEDGFRWRRLRRLGAPDLPELDLDHLLDEGGWRYLDAEAVAPHANGQSPNGHAPDGATAESPAAASRRRRPRGRGRSRPQPAAASA